MSNLNTQPALILGLQTVARDGYERFFAAPEAAKSCTTDAGKQKNIADQVAKRQAEAHLMPVAATMSDVVILDDVGTLLYADKTGNNPIAPIMVIEEWLDINPAGVLVGIGIRENLRMLLLDSLYGAAKLGVRFRFHHQYWLASQFEKDKIYDPYSVFLGTQELRNAVPVANLCTFLGLDGVTQAWDATAETQARTAMLLYNVLAGNYGVKDDDQPRGSAANS